MREVGCYICGSKKASVLRDQDTHDIYLDLVDPEYNRVKRYWKACECGFVYQTPILTDEDNKILYENFRKVIKETPDGYFDRIISLPKNKSENHIKLQWLVTELKKHSYLPKNVLDVGCGNGVLLHTLKTLYPGISMTGVEPNKTYAEIAKRRAGIDVIQDYYRKGLFDRKFDLILCSQTLEHVYDLRSFISALANDLNGAIYIDVPDAVDFEKLPTDYHRFFAQHIYYGSSKFFVGKNKRLPDGISSLKT